MPSGTILYNQYGGTGSQQVSSGSGGGGGFNGGGFTAGVPAPSQPVTAIATGSKGKRAPAVVNYVFTVVLAADNTPQPLQGFLVPDGCEVRVRGNNGTTAGNQAVIFVADNRDKFARGAGAPLAPLDDVAWPVKNLAHLWVYGKAADGVVVSVLSSANQVA